MTPEERGEQTYDAIMDRYDIGVDSEFHVEIIAKAILAAEREAAEREREACCAAIRDACPMCDDGHFLEDPSGQTECEYCGRPIHAIRARGGKS